MNDGSELENLTVGDISRRHQMVVVTYTRDGNTVFHPPLDVELEPGDILRIECDPQTLKEIHLINRDPINV
ncbi:MAG: TrkA C-terminal domain-containing protein [Planctomycetota bacterium]